MIADVFFGHTEVLYCYNLCLQVIHITLALTENLRHLACQSDGEFLGEGALAIVRLGHFLSSTYMKRYEVSFQPDRLLSCQQQQQVTSQLFII